MLLSTAANNVLQEFGGAMPDNLISFEDATREFLNVRALELQKLGIATGDHTVTKSTLNASDRDGLVSPIFGEDMIPGFVELHRFDANYENDRDKVEIISVDLIPSYEGGRAIAFYGTPKRYRLAWDAWDEGTITVYYDPVEDITEIGQSQDITFPAAFWTFLIKKAALNLIRVALVKLAIIDPAEFRTSKQDISKALTSFVALISPQVLEWEREFHKFRNADLNTQPHLRRTTDEINYADWSNVTGVRPLDLIG